MQIGAVAKKTGVSVDAIRFYERSALLPKAPRTAGGFRRYGESDLEALAFIRRVKALGFTLSEVRELLELRRSGLQPCARCAAVWNRKFSKYGKNSPASKS